MQILKLKMNSSNIVATVEEAGVSWDVVLPDTLSKYQDYVDAIKAAVLVKKQSQLTCELQSLVGVDLTDPVAIFAATLSASQGVGKLLVPPPAPAIAPVPAK
jgi:hypothetical protein